MSKYRSFIFPFDELTDEEKETINSEGTSPEKGGNKEE